MPRSCSTASFRPCPGGAEYTAKTLTNDLIVAGIVTVMLIAQSMAYALWAGLPVQVGLFACMAALVLYGLFGTSRTLAVGSGTDTRLMTERRPTQGRNWQAEREA